MCAFYFFWLSASHGLRLGMDGMLLALCDHGFERSGLCAVNNIGKDLLEINFLFFSLTVRWRRSLHFHCERSQSVVIASKIAKNY